MMTEAVEWALKRRNRKNPHVTSQAEIERYFAHLDERIAHFKKIETDLAFRTYEQNIDYSEAPEHADPDHAYRASYADPEDTVQQFKTWQMPF